MGNLCSSGTTPNPSEPKTGARQSTFAAAGKAAADATTVPAISTQVTVTSEAVPSLEDKAAICEQDVVMKTAPRTEQQAGIPPSSAQLPQAVQAPSAAVAAPKAYNTPESKLRTDVKLRDVYKLGKTLGTGGFSVVKLAIDKQTGKEYACKIMALPPAGQEVGENENTRDDIFKEIDLLCGMNHENVIYLKEYFEEGNKVYLITELLTGGELLEAVLRRGNYNERDARICFIQVLRGIEYLHSKHVVHRDLKLENLLLAAADDIRLVKIADFGLAKNAQNGMQTICGTPQYVAPEVIVGQKGHMYGPGVDMWSAGVVLFILLGGYPPFWSDSEPQLFEQIRKGRYSFNDPVWSKVSEGAKDLIQHLLVVDPTKRLSASQALQHAWVTAASMEGPELEPLQEALMKLRDLPMSNSARAAA